MDLGPLLHLSFSLLYYFDGLWTIILPTFGVMAAVYVAFEGARAAIMASKPGHARLAGSDAFGHSRPATRVILSYSLNS